TALGNDIARVFEADGSLKPVLVADTEHRLELHSPEHPSVFSQARFVALPAELGRLAIEDRDNLIGSLIQEHHSANQGTLEPLGKILRYMFFDAAGTATQYAVDGQSLPPGTVFFPIP